MGRFLYFLYAIALLLFFSSVNSHAQGAAATEPVSNPSSTPPLSNTKASPNPFQKIFAPNQKSSSTSPATKSHVDELRKSFEKLSQDDQQKFIQSIHSKSPNSATSKPTASPANESPRLEEFRHTFSQFSQDEQHKFLINLHRWESMSSEERENMRRIQRNRDRKREEDAIDAYQKSGLHLNEAQRQVFRKHYIQERQKLENQLDSEMQIKRKQGNETIIDQLKKEFQP